MSTYEIVEAKSKNELKEFLKLPLSVFPDRKNTKHVMTPFLLVKDMMGKLNDPNKKLYLAKHEGKPVARIAVKVHEHGGKETLHFGFFECVEGHKEAAVQLIRHARNFRPQLKFMGPFHFRLEDPFVGVLVEGFQYDPYFLMPYNPPYYDEYLKAAGLVAAMDLFTYEAIAATPPPESIKNNAEAVRKNGYSIRTINMKSLWNEAKTIQKIFNDALSNNWGYEEFLDDQVREMVNLFKLFIDPRVVFMAEKNGQTAGCLIMLPDYNPVIKSGDGRVTPRVIWDFFRTKGKLQTIRGYALGVLREFHGQGIASLIVDEAWNKCRDAGYKKCEISWILASNGPMNELSKHMGGKQNKVYRIYELH